MRFLKILTLLTAALVLIGCTFTVNLPSVKTGPTQTLNIAEAPETGAEVSNVIIEMGAGSLDITGGTDQLVEGTITYNFEAWKPVITRDSNTVTLSQKTTSTVSLPSDMKLKNEWQLKLGEMPIALNLSTGAYEGNLNLGGLAITSLSISDGASSSKIRFDEPNTTAMSLLTYSTGASDVELLGLGNANVSTVEFNSGVGDYTLDFSGENTTDCNVSIKSGVSSLKIIIPSNARAEVTIDGELNNVELNGTWTTEGNRYMSGTDGALIRINIDMAIGDLELIQE